MCGILGFCRTSNKPGKRVLTMNQIQDAFSVADSRGGDATGMWTPETGTIKTPGDSLDFFKKSHLANIGESQIMIGHTRATTKGSEKDNTNNHPHEGKRFVLVHNGHFSNLPSVAGYKLKGECDSEEMLALVETFGVEDGLRCTTDDDKFALVILDKKSGDLYLYRHTNPLVVAYDGTLNSYLFASTSEILDEFTLREGPLQVFTCSWPITLTEHTLVKIAPNGDLSHERIAPMKSRYAIRSLPKEITDKLVNGGLPEYYGRHPREDYNYAGSGRLGQRALAFAGDDEGEYLPDLFVSTRNGELAIGHPMRFGMAV